MPQANRESRTVFERHFLADIDGWEDVNADMRIDVFREQHRRPSALGDEWVNGRAILFTDSGLSVIRIRRGKYEIPDLNGMTLTSDDADAE
jgi:hypothetical protein